MQQSRAPMSDWSSLAPERCATCGRTRLPQGLDWSSQWANALNTPLMDSWSRLMSGLLEPWMQAIRASMPAMPAMPAARGVEHPRDCGCARCADDDCACRCCVSDADLLVQARVGERRVVPLILENTSRRERAVTLELSDWSTRTGQPARVTGALLPPTSLTLRPCEERSVVFEVSIAYAGDERGAKTDAGVAAEITAVDVNQRRLPDVDDCQVFYADLRVTGCDIRPIRIALAVLPRDCAAYRIDCRCTCC